MRRLLSALALLALAAAPVAAQSPKSLTEKLDDLGRGDKPFALRVTFSIKSDKIEEFLALAREAALFTNGKDGCTSYRFYQSLTTPTDFLLFEEWPDSKTLKTHMDAPHTKVLLGSASKLSAKPIALKMYRSATERDPAGSPAAPATQAGADGNAKLVPKIGDELKAKNLAGKPFALVVDLKTGTGQAPAMKDAATKVTQPTLAEPGCVRFGFFQDLEAPESFISFETWKDAAALEAHAGTPQFKALVEALAKVESGERAVAVYVPLAY